MHGLHAADTTILGVYLVGVAGIGIWSGLAEVASRTH